MKLEAHNVVLREEGPKNWEVSADLFVDDVHGVGNSDIQVNVSVDESVSKCVRIEFNDLGQLVLRVVDKKDVMEHEIVLEDPAKA